MLLRSGCVFSRSQSNKLESFERLVLKLSLNTEVRDIQVNVVILKLMLDVEISIVPGIELVRIQRPGSIEGIGIRVDIEISLHLTIYRVDLAGEGSGSTLLTIRSVADHSEGKIVVNLERGVEISGITPYRTLKGPTRIFHYRDRSIVCTPVGTAGCTH